MDSKKRIPLKQAIETARIISEQYNIKSYKDWRNFIEKGVFIVSPAPLGKTFLLFKEAKKYVKSLGIKSMQEWRVYCNENHNITIPSHPAKHYKNEWVSWEDFLGGEHKIPSKFEDYETAKCFVHRIKPRINNCREWDEYCKSGKKPKDIPHSPQKIYKDYGWIGWDCWFGSGLYELGISDEEVQLQIDFERGHIEEQMEEVRYSYDTDEELMEAYEQEATDIINAVKKYIEAHPREEEEE
jgi:hypothetical protein